ncbi:MAG: hypothetical protein II993_01860 [Anaerotignum sp.]|nr:hypothetical protein [Anaerotignum sp.]
MKKKHICTLLLCVFCSLFTGCSGSAIGLPEKDPVGTLRSYYADGKEGKIADFYIKYKIIAETSDISYPSAEVRTLPSQENMEITENTKHTLYHVALWDQSSLYIYHPLLTLDILSDKEWYFETEDDIISIEEDKILFEITYGPNQSSTILYSIKDDTFTEVTTE